MNVINVAQIRKKRRVYLAYKPTCSQSFDSDILKKKYSKYAWLVGVFTLFD